ncbi:unnamed protein product [Parnassius mnemosyne]|uniref:Reverse transcriptase domain-containing protein n=1 Tax=Parnassius mnemosyne TaxID=213953 RepID=A0AAV1KIW8_9NEOP
MNSYLEDRKVRVRYASKEYIKVTNKGCIQGSIGGPTFWNILLDPLLDELERRGIYCQAFADDIVLVFSGESVTELERQADQTLTYVEAWGIKNKLKFAVHKTSAMVVTKKLKFETPWIHMGEVEIQMVDQIKMLGLIIDKKLTFQQHVSYVCTKATNIYKQLSSSENLLGAESGDKRTMYVAVVEPVISYAAGVWGEAAGKISIQKMLNAV